MKLQRQGNRRPTSRHDVSGVGRRKSLVLSLLLCLCLRSASQEQPLLQPKEEPTPKQGRAHDYQTETGFLTVHQRSGTWDSSLLSAKAGSAWTLTGHGLVADDVALSHSHSPPIWSDPHKFCSCWNSSDGGKVREVECKCNGTMTQLIPTLPTDVHRIVIKDGPNFTLLRKDDLRPYAASLKEISLTDLAQFVGIEDGALTGLPHLDTIYLMETPALTSLSQGVFHGWIPKLKTIRISHSSLSVVPWLSRLKTTAHLDLVDLENNKIEALEEGWLANVEINYLSLSYNRLEEIGPNAFTGSTISRLKLKGNRRLVRLDPAAFSGIQHLSELDLSESAITHLPIQGLQFIEQLRLENVFSLRVIPSILNFDNLKEAWLTFPYHCCAFHFPETHNPEEFAKHRAFIQTLAERGCDESNPHMSTPTAHLDLTSPATPLKVRRDVLHKSTPPNPQAKTDGRKVGMLAPHEEFDPFAQEAEKSFGDLAMVGEENPQVQGHGDSRGDDFGTFHANVVLGSPPTRVIDCGHVTKKKAPAVKCSPVPDAFSPCEDIMGNAWLRVAVWVVVGLALVGNTAVLVVLLLAPGKMSVQRFLMANLSWADLCMGLYLLMVATEDLVSLGAYFNYAIDWQLGWGCQLAGFFTVFASELSVFTLAVITGERWYALTRALHLTKRLTIVKAAELMSFGWVVAILLAALPLLGVSSYSRTSICLPMEATTPEAQGYLAFLLIFNGVAFSLVAYAYWQMYRAVAGHGNMNGGAPAAHSADAAIAKKMALLVFTDFACWAPVAFFGLTAVAGAPLIGVTDSKILLVFFYPLNACCNPYLYAILTKQYRRDLLLLLSRHGICTRRAARYKTGQTGSTNNTMHTMQTILRLGSVAETKVTNGGHGRISVGSMGGHSVQSGASTASSALSRVSSGHGFALEGAMGGQRSQKPSVCSIPEDFDAGEEGGNLLAETTFISLQSTAESGSGMRGTGKQKHVRISTDESPERDGRFLKKADSSDMREQLGDVEGDVTESTPFCP